MRFHALPTVSALAGLIAMLDGASLVASASIVQDDPPKPQLVLVRVEDEAGEPIEDATVTLTYRSQSPDTFGDSQRSSYQTDSIGQSVIECPADAYHPRIFVDKSGFVPQSYVARNNSRHELPDEVFVQLEPGIEIGGIVKNELGAPIENARVELMLESTETAFSNLNPGVKQTHFVEGERAPTTDADGRWHFSNAPKDVRVRVRVSHSNYASDAYYPSNRPDLRQSHYRDGTAEITMGNGIELTGRVLDGNQRPIKGAIVYAERGGKQQWFSESTETNADGKFRFRLLEPGRCKVGATAVGWAPQLQEVDVSKSSANNVQLVLDKGSPLRLQVLDSSDKPLRAAIAIQWNSSGILTRNGMAGRPDPILPTRTNAEGIFDWPHAPAGMLKIAISARGYRMKTIEATAGGQVISTKLEPVQQLTGQCVDRMTGEPIKRFSVCRLLHEVYPDRSSMVVGVDGLFTLSDDMLDEEAKLIVEAPGYRTLITKQTVGGASPPRELKIELEPAQDVSGTVVNENGRPVGGAVVSIRPSNSLATITGNTPPEHLRVTTDRNGKFQFPAQLQSFSLLVWSNQGFTRKRFSRNSTELGELKLQSNGQIRGVVERNGTPIAGVKIVLNHPLDSVMFESDIDGLFEFTQVPTGNLALYIVDPRPNDDGKSPRSPLSQSIQLGPGETANVTVELEK